MPLYNPAGGGGIGGTVGATDNAVPRADGAGGSTLQSSSVIIDDSGNVKFGNIIQAVNGSTTVVRSPAGGGNVTIQNAFLEAALTFGDNRRVNAAAITLTPTRPAQITANQNDYGLGNANSTTVYLNSDAARNITGIASTLGTGTANTESMWHRLINNGGFNITLKHQDAASAAANRFLNSTGADIVLAPNEIADIHYDATAQRWRAAKL